MPLWRSDTTPERDRRRRTPAVHPPRGNNGRNRTDEQGADMDQAGAVMAVIVPVVAALGWLFSLHGRLNGHDREIGDVKDDLRYIRDRIDQVITLSRGDR